jgi:hypothetical protein
VNRSRTMHMLLGLAVGALCTTASLGQFSQLVTGFDTDALGDAYGTQPGSRGDLQVVMFQDPAEADVTTNNVLADASATFQEPNFPDPSSEESFVATFAGFGAPSGTQFMDVRFEWANNDPNRWALVETLQSPILGDPSLHLGGELRMYINIPDCSAFEFSSLTRTAQVGVALLISETGRDLPQGFQDNDVLNGNFEFVGVSALIDPNSNNPIPVPTRMISITDNNCSGSDGGDWVQLTFDFATESVVGWTARGGDGVLDATGMGDGVNRGVLAGLVLTVNTGDTTGEYVEFLIDDITFEAPVTEPAIAPSIVGPVVFDDTEVQINDVIPRATLVTLEIDRADPNDDPNVFTVDETLTLDPTPPLSPTSELRSVSIGVSPALAIGDRLRAKQQVGADVSDYSLEVLVNPPAAFSATLSLDEAGSLGGAAVFEWVGAVSVVGSAGTQGKPIFPQNGVWQRLEYSLIPGVEPVIDFAGGNGQLEPDGGLYNIDAMFFTIDSSSPSTGPYDIYIDHVFYTDVNGFDSLLSDAETANPFALNRGQSTSVLATRSNTLSTNTSYDGITSSRIQWEFDTLAASNTHAPYRPNATFADSAKAVGMYLLVEDFRDPNALLQPPTIEQVIIGAAPGVVVSDIDPAATMVDLLVDGVVVTSIDPNGATAVNIDPTVALQVGESISAQTYVNLDSSFVAFPRVVRVPGPPTVQGPLFENQTAVTVNNISNTGNAVASLVTLYADGMMIGSQDPMGQASVSFTLNPGLVLGEQITATQTINTLESAESAPVGVGSGETVCVVINEIQYDDSGTNDRQYVELYNAEPNAVDISGWTLRCSDDTAPPLDDNPDYVIPAATVLAAGDYYVIGAGSVANVDLVVGTTNLFEDANEGYELLDENGVVVDTVITELNKGPIAISPAEGGFYGNFVSIDTTPQSLSRWTDGYDTDDNGRDFGILPITPGTTNNIVSLDPLTENFDASASGDVPNFIGSFVNMNYINPTVVDTFNKNAIPASSQGGNAGICWDPTGGGNQCALNDEARYNVGFSCEIYIDSTGGAFDPNAFASENENWSIGLGTVGSFHNSFSANGNTGLMWEYLFEEDPNGDIGTLQLQLLDRNNGGTDGTVLLDVDPNLLTTGWHTISIERNYESYTASFDSVMTSGTVAANGPSTLQMGYREFAAGSAEPDGLRPITIDALVVTEPTPPILGACCTDCGCTLLTEATCVAIGGSYAGDSTDCTDNDMNGVADACDALNSPAPVVSSPICTDDLLVELTGIVPEASQVTIYDGGVNPIATAVPGGAATIRVFVPGGFTLGQMISATQTVGAFESALSNEVTVTDCGDTPLCLALFEDNFDTDTSANWTVNQSTDSAIAFAYDYSADSIPPAPNGTGTTLGVKMEANIVGVAAAYVIASPTGISPTGDYQIQVDYWINYDINDPTGNTTEFIGGGVGYDGVTVERDGQLFIATGDGGSSRDYRLYKNSGSEQRIGIADQEDQFAIPSQNNLDATIAALFPGQTPPAGQGQTGTAPDGSQAFAWHTLTITVDSTYQTVNFDIDGVDIGTLICGGEYGPACNVAGALQLFYGDVFSSLASSPSLQFGIFDNFAVYAAQTGPVVLFDWNGDAMVNGDDYAGIDSCLGGPDNSPALQGCGTECADGFDVEPDADVDMADLAIFQRSVF